MGFSGNFPEEQVTDKPRSHFWCHIMFAVISHSNSLNLTNFFASDTHHQFHKLCLQMCFTGEAHRFFRVFCVQLELGLHWAFPFPSWQQHRTEERLLDIRHFYSHSSLFTGKTNNCTGAHRRLKKISSFACTISKQQQFPGLVQLCQQEQVAGPGTAYTATLLKSRPVWLPHSLSQIAFPLFHFETGSRYWIRADDHIQSKNLGIWSMQK